MIVIIIFCQKIKIGYIIAGLPQSLPNADQFLSIPINARILIGTDRHWALIEGVLGSGENGIVQYREQGDWGQKDQGAGSKTKQNKTEKSVSYQKKDGMTPTQGIRHLFTLRSPYMIPAYSSQVNSR